MLDVPIVLFVVTSILLIVTPGQDMVLVMSRSISQGAKAGVVTAAGVSVGLLGHTLLACLGLGALLQTSEFLFSALKIAGAFYLIYLGIKAFKAPPVQIDSTESHLAPRALFIQGAVSNLSNPKIAIFYFAFLPQFVSSNTVNTQATLVFLGALFALLTFLVKGPVALLAGSLSHWLRNRPPVQKWLNRTSGVVLVGLGVRLAFEERAG